MEARCLHCLHLCPADDDNPYVVVVVADDELATLGSGSFPDRGSVVDSADYHPGGYLPILRPVTVSDDLPTYLPTYQLLPPSQRPPRAAVRLPAQLLLIVAGHDHGVRPHLAAIPRAMVQPPALRHRPPHS